MEGINCFVMYPIRYYQKISTIQWVLLLTSDLKSTSCTHVQLVLPVNIQPSVRRLGFLLFFSPHHKFQVEHGRTAARR